MAAAGEGHSICLSEKVLPAGVSSASNQMLHVMQHLQRDELFIGSLPSLVCLLVLSLVTSTPLIRCCMLSQCRH